MKTTEKTRKNTLTFILLLTVSLMGIALNRLSAVEFDIRGFLDTYHAIRTKSPNDFLSSRTRLRLEIQNQINKALFFVSLNLAHNNIIPSETGVELREAYLHYTSKNWDIRIGRQIIVWGNADGLQITDIISPLDLTEFLARDYDDIRTPVDALRFRLLWDKVKIELVWVPIFRSAIFPPDGSPWAPQIDAPGDFNLRIRDPVSPTKKIGNSELFGKLSLHLPGIDLAFSGFYTWDDFGVTHRYLFQDSTGTNLEIQQEYYRLSGFGAEFSLPAGFFVLRGEAAFYAGKCFEPKELSNPIIKKNALHCLLGLDWYPGNNWVISTQLVDQMILNYNSDIQESAHTLLTTLSVSKTLFRDTLTVSNFLYLDLDELGFFDRFSVDYALTDELHIISGIDYFGGQGGTFSPYLDNTEVFFKVKYSF